MANRPASSNGGADMALLGACRKGDLRRVEELWPCAKFPREMFKFISSFEAKPNEEFDHFENVLHAACAEGRTDVVKYLVEKQHMFVVKPDSRSNAVVDCIRRQSYGNRDIDWHWLPGNRKYGRPRWAGTVSCSLCHWKCGTH
jgi:hypothetical protein